MKNRYRRPRVRLDKRKKKINVFGMLPQYTPTPAIKQLYKAQFLLSDQPTIVETEIFNLINSGSLQLTDDNYYDVYSTAIQIEDLHQGSEMTITNRRILPAKTNRRILHLTKLNQYRLELREQDQIPSDIINGDILEIYEYPNEMYLSTGTLLFANANRKYMLFESMYPINLSKNINYSIKFDSSRLTFRLERWALDKIKQTKLSEIILNPTQIAIEDDDDEQNDIQFVEQRILQNPEQQIAVKSIVLSRPSSVPFLLIGYPGTGKTQIIVECIHQLLMRNPENRILVCAGINLILDEIAERLQKSLDSTPEQIQQNKILRYYATSQRESKRTERLHSNSNFVRNFEKTIIKTGAVLCTFAMAGELSFSFPKINFTHIFIDEAQSATETQTLIPIAAFCSEQFKTKIILAGDTKQLGPVVKTKQANKLGYGRSMMERLLTCDIYQPYAQTKLFNHSVICKLIRNYRSHPEILKIPNELFYNNEMISCATSETIPNRMVIRTLQSFGIITSAFPNVFHFVRGLTRTYNSSMYNSREITYLIDLLYKLLQANYYDKSEIGIITPYRQQATRIKSLLKVYNLEDIKVGTVKEFIGQEKLVIIVSTVRSQTKGLGFLADEKRINVLLTRAISFMIFIGNKKTLSQNPIWVRIIQNCSNNHSIFLTT